MLKAINIVDTDHIRKTIERNIRQCIVSFKVDILRYHAKNISFSGKCKPNSNYRKEISKLIVRVSEIKHMYSANHDDISVIVMTVMRGHKPLNSSEIADIITYIGYKKLSSVLNVELYDGKIYPKRAAKLWLDSPLKEIFFSSIGKRNFFWVSVRVNVGIFRFCRTLPSQFIARNVSLCLRNCFTSLFMCRSFTSLFMRVIVFV